MRVHLSVLQQIMTLINIAGMFTVCAACQQSYPLSHYPPREYMYVCLTERLNSTRVPVLAQDGQNPWTSFPLNPISFPLAVKTPYVSAWNPPGNRPMSLSWPESLSFTVSSLVSIRHRIR